jgi:hypothetical protein
MCILHLNLQIKIPDFSINQSLPPDILATVWGASCMIFYKKNKLGIHIISENIYNVIL